jgi:hypothetical protein
MQFDQLNRCGFIALLGAAAAWGSRRSPKHQPGAPRITFLGGSQPRPTATVADTFIEGMRLGYTEGRDFEMEYR